jgi:hypothetical protein
MNRRGLRAQDELVAQIQGVEGRACDVCGGHVQRVEEVARCDDLRPFDDLVAEPEEGVLDLAADLRDQVEMAPRDRVSGQGDVDSLGRQDVLELLPLQLGPPFLDSALERLAKRVQSHAGLAVSDLAQSLFQLTAPAEVADARGVEVLGGRGARNLAQSLGFQRFRVHRPNVSSGSSCGRARPVATNLLPTASIARKSARM